jgi:hypothetical protein
VGFFSIRHIKVFLLLLPDFDGEGKILFGAVYQSNFGRLGDRRYAIKTLRGGA